MYSINNNIVPRPTNLEDSIGHHRVPRTPDPEGSLRILAGASAVSDFEPGILTDESGMAGSWCEEACWPSSAAEAAEYVGSCASRNLPLTISGGRTGVVAGALPDGGAVLSTSLMKRIGPVEGCMVAVEAGVTLEELSCRLSSVDSGLFFPPDPTEATASLGGMAATDASGSDSLLYGSTRRWVESADLVLPDGSPVILRRGEYAFGPVGTCRHPAMGTLVLGKTPEHPGAKDAAGYALREGMDLLDLFLGSEGTLGLVTGLVLRLAPKPYAIIDAVLFHPDSAALWPLAGSVRESGLALRALEVMDGACLDFMRLDPLPGAVLPPEGASCAVMARLESSGDAMTDSILGRLDDLATSSGIPGDFVWAGFDEAWDSRVRSFRHSLPEMVNREISRLRLKVPGIRKYGSDSAVSPELTGDFHTGIRAILDGAGLTGVVFGHAGQGHLHANAIPRDGAEMEASARCMHGIARLAVSMGGTVSAEHGLGRLKGELLAMMHPPGVIESMTRLRRTLDPDGRFGPAIRWA